MPYKMRRKHQELTTERAYEILKETSYGVLSLLGEEDGAIKPYGVPISHMLIDGSLYFHCAFEGRKLDCVKQYPAASFCAVGSAEFGDEGNNVTMYYESVIASGFIHIVSDEIEKRKALYELTAKFLSDGNRVEKLVNEGLDATCILCMPIENIAGKQRKSK